MTQATQTFEAGTNGNTITTGADSLAATSWNAVTLGSGTETYSSSSPAVGTLSGKISTTTASGTYLEWSTAVGTLTNHYGRFYLKTSVVNATRVYASFYRTGTLAAYIFTDATGHLGIDASSGGTATCASALTANTWYRVEYHIVHSATVGQVSISYYASLESTSATDSATTSANVNTLQDCNTYRFGIGCGVTTYASTDVYLDAMVAGAASAVGPAGPSNTVAPAVTGTATVGQVLTATTGTWIGDATITYAYQWKRDAVSIGGETASTHTIVSADQGTTLTCVVTATNANASASATSNSTSIAAAVVSTGPIVNPGLAGYLVYTGRV